MIKPKEQQSKEEHPKIITVEEIEKKQIQEAKQQSSSQGSQEEIVEEESQEKEDSEEIGEGEEEEETYDPSTMQEHISHLSSTSIQNPYASMDDPNQTSQMHQYFQAQNEMQTQQMIEQLNQEHIKNTLLQNPNTMMQYQQEMMYNGMNHNYGNDEEDNPFAPILKENPTSQWLYKDPQGLIRGPFSCFDMCTWYNEGYFKEDLELSLDGNNFFRLCDLRVVGQRKMEESINYGEDYSQYYQAPSGYGYEGSKQASYMPQSQYDGYSAQNIPMDQYYSGHSPQMAFPTFGQPMAYQPSPNYGQDYTHGYYSPINSLGEGNMQLPPFSKEN